MRDVDLNIDIGDQPSFPTIEGRVLTVHAGLSKLEYFAAKAMAACIAADSGKNTRTPGVLAEWAVDYALALCDRLGYFHGELSEEELSSREDEWRAPGPRKIFVPVGEGNTHVPISK